MIRTLLKIGLLLPLMGAGQMSIQPGRATVASGAVITVCPHVTVGSQIREFCTSSVTWHATTTGANITVEAIGGGGGGYFDGGAVSGTAGGGGGEYASSSVAYTSGSNITVTVGVGGPGATSTNGSATAGGNSSFASSVIAKGGPGYSGTVVTTPRATSRRTVEASPDVSVNDPRAA